MILKIKKTSLQKIIIGVIILFAAAAGVNYAVRINSKIDTAKVKEVQLDKINSREIKNSIDIALNEPGVYMYTLANKNMSYVVFKGVVKDNPQFSIDKERKILTISYKTDYSVDISKVSVYELEWKKESNSNTINLLDDGKQASFKVVFGM